MLGTHRRRRNALEEAMCAFDALVQEGKVRVIGASNYDGGRLRAAEEVSGKAGQARYETLQPNYNMHTREQYETDLAPVVAEFNLGVAPYFSLASTRRQPTQKRQIAQAC